MATVYNAELNITEALAVRGEFTTAVVLDMVKLRTNPQITSAGLFLIADDTPVVAVAGDDVTIEGSVDGVHYFKIGDSNAEVVYGLDDNGITQIAGKLRYLKFTAAQVQATEYYKFSVLVDKNFGEG